MKNIAIIGSGSFGCAIANALAKENNVKIWSYKEEEKEKINNEHSCLFLENSKLEENIICYTNYEDVISGSDYIFVITPSNVIRNTFIDIKPYITNQKIIIASKGLEIESKKLLSEVAKEIISNEIGILSGPSIANEVINNLPCEVTFASNNNNFNDEIEKLFLKSNLKIEKSNDIIGTELGGSFKNIIALASGILSGLNLGKNIEAVLMTKGLSEIESLGVSLGAKEETFYGLSGLGDLIVTCSSNDSRNKRAGELLSKGKKIEEIKKEIGMVIEGLDAIEIAIALLKDYNLDLPIISTLYNIINGIEESNKIVEAILKK